jgi:hypothetical protein
MKQSPVSLSPDPPLAFLYGGGKGKGIGAKNAMH